MDEEKTRYWLKLDKGFLKSTHIKVIKNMQNGKDYIIFYLSLMLESVETVGHLRFSDLVPYNEEMLSSITDTNIDIVRQAVKLFSELGLITILVDGTIYLPAVPKMTGKSSESRERVQLYREKNNIIKTELLTTGNLPYIEKYQNNKFYNGLYYDIVSRDKGKCKKCNSTINLCVHHIIGYRENDPISCEKWAMILLCRICHSQEHSQPLSITQDLLIKIGFDMNYYDKIKEISNTTGNKKLIDVTCNDVVTNSNDNIEIDKDKDKDKDIDKEVKHKYGFYNHVLLTDKEYDNLIYDFGDRSIVNEWIKKLDEGIQIHGYKYKDHNLVIRKWKGNEDKKKKINTNWGN